MVSQWEALRVIISALIEEEYNKTPFTLLMISCMLNNIIGGLGQILGVISKNRIDNVAKRSDVEKKLSCNDSIIIFIYDSDHEEERPRWGSAFCFLNRRGVCVWRLQGALRNSILYCG